MSTLPHGDTRLLGGGTDTPVVHLTRREIQILTLLFEGKPSQMVADHLKISKRTVDFHLDNIYEKLNVTNRAQACFEAARRGLITFGAVRQFPTATN